MLLTLLILQALITQVLRQTHQQVLAQLQNFYHGLPVMHETTRRAVLKNAQSITACLQTPERQFYSAHVTVCEAGQCHEFMQFFSEGSAILKEDIQFHSIRHCERAARSNLDCFGSTLAMTSR